MDDENISGLRVRYRESALWLTLDRPHRRNALTLDLVDHLVRVLADLPGDIGAVVLTGAPPAFCSGGDIQDLDAVAADGPLAVSDAIYSRFQRLVSAIASAPVPVIAAVNGPALGGGFDLALSCDLRVATPEAEFASSWIAVGLVPGMGGAHMLTRLVGAGRAAELALLGKKIGVVEAERWGLVNAVVPTAGLESYLAEVTDSLAGRSRPALQRTKAALRRARDAGLAEELTLLGAVQGTLSTRGDFHAATERFRRG
ncbi:enoyl-CoA hydratase/isomerase family protein [Amycolatopsis pigmentata]|uniref:Enoyl-CoA hydratase/isomerase family protein n=1 Tax=Amycolatopsis pigmentata TaxID=450801 RepID=A0ABW5G536_9PSEU